MSVQSDEPNARPSPASSRSGSSDGERVAGKCVWDGTIDAKSYTHSDLITIFKNFCSKWTFQLERGKELTLKNPEGYLHYQCRISLKTEYKTRNCSGKLGMKDGESRWSMTCAKMMNDFSHYVTKPDTWMDGPWKHTDKPMHRDLVGLTLRPWQQKIYELCQEVYPPRDERLRQVNVLVDEEGKIGKNIIQNYLEHKLKAVKVPPFNDMAKFIGYIAKHPGGASKVYTINMPRMADYKKLVEFYTGIEALKDGDISDWRYHTSVMQFDIQPHVWIFMNEMPNLRALTHDRWVIWRVIENILIKF